MSFLFLRGLGAHTFELLVADVMQRQRVETREGEIVHNEHCDTEPDVACSLGDGEALELSLALGVSVAITRELGQHVTTQRPGDRREPVHPDPVVRDQVGQDNVTREQEEETHRDGSQCLADRADGVLEGQEHKVEHDVLLERPRQATHEVEEGAQHERDGHVHWDLHHTLGNSVRRRAEEVTRPLLVENLAKLERDGDLLPRLTLEQSDTEEDHAQVVRRAHVVVDHTHDQSNNQRLDQFSPQQRRVTNPHQLLPVQQQHRAGHEGQSELGFLLGTRQVGHTLGLLEVFSVLELVLVEALADASWVLRISVLGPWYTMWPSLTIKMSSNISTTSGVGCSRAITADPPSVLHQVRNDLMISKVAALSRPVEISSHRNKLWPPTSTSPIVTRLRSPPLTPRSSASPTTVSAHSSMPKIWRKSSVLNAAMSRISSGWSSGRPLTHMSANLNVSLTVNVAMWLSVWSTSPANLMRSISSPLSPEYRICPPTLVLDEF
ncbi:hypothetical protein GQ600_17527 [Phytophthora cactorum]|nr:hypothetical protein GQ600_17527 [Phytophthora cactorum]